jgi:hypothetical protein
MLGIGSSAGEANADSLAAAEMARLWLAMKRSVEAVNAAHGVAATGVAA